jgi:predicted nucleotidyltransferase component of viral defense system
MEDKAASVLTRLMIKSKETGRSYQLCLQLFCQEELLRRVALSKYTDNLILKGGMFIYTLSGFESRPTIDVDFLLQHIRNSQQNIEEMINEILRQDTGNDFIQFELKDISDISMTRKYHGVSVRLIGRIKNTRSPFSIDFGIGDVIVPKPEKRIIPTQLDGFIRPEINTYSLESTIAEKLDAMLQRMEFTSRMKDYFDVFYLANTFSFDGRKLQEAIFETLQNRGTNYGKESFKSIVGFASDNDMNVRWRLFLRKQKQTEPAFSSVLNTLSVFLNPAYEAIVNETEFFGQWDKDSMSWRNV